MKKTLLTSLAIATIFTACAKYEPSPNMVNLKASFTDSKWNAETVPKDEVCQRYNKKGGNTPSITIQNLPQGTNKVILTFSDNNPSSQMTNGGHGIISYKVSEVSNSLIIPSVKGQTFDLPKNFNSEVAHQAGRWGFKAGAYLPPCSGGKGNPYSVKIQTIKEYTDSNKKPMLLGETDLSLGRY